MARYALVTGSSSGLGFEIIHYLLDRGYAVFGASRKGSSITHPKYVDLIADLRDEGSVEEMFSEINGHTPGLHLAIHCAGIFQMSPIAESSSDEFWTTLESNLLGSFHFLKHLNHYLIENESHIMMLSSSDALIKDLNLGAFGASQRGLDGLVETCKKEWKELGIRFSLLKIGPVDTTFWNEVEGFVAREDMLSLDEFMHVFTMVESSSKRIEFDQIVFGPRPK